MDRLCGLVVRVPGYRSRAPCSIPSGTRFSEKQWDWGSCLENREYCRRDPLRWPRGILYPQTLGQTSPTWLLSFGRYSSLADSDHGVKAMFEGSLVGFRARLCTVIPLDTNSCCGLVLLITFRYKPESTGAERHAFSFKSFQINDHSLTSSSVSL
jgi:hypothetical protein